MFKFFAELTRKHAKQIVIFWIVLSVPVILGVTRLDMKTSQRDLVPTKYESARAVRHLDDIFGGMSYEFIILEDLDMTSYPVVKKLILLEDQLYKHGIRKDDVVSISTYVDEIVKGAKKETGKSVIDEDFFKSFEGQLVPSPLGGFAEFKTVILQGLELMMSNPTWWKWNVDKGELLTPDKRCGQVILKISPKLNSSQQQEVVSKIENFARDYFGGDPELGNPKILFTGDPSISRDLSNYISRNTLVLILVAFAFLLIILYLTFRRMTDVFLPLLIIALSVVWIFGLMGWVGFPFTLISVAMAPLILGINIADVAYMMSRFYEELHGGKDARSSASRSITTVGVAVFLAGITTFFGFLSFTLSDLPAIQQFGVMAGFGEVIGFLFAVTLLPAVMILREEYQEKKGKEVNEKRLNIFARGKTTLMDGFLKRSADLSCRHPLGILCVAALMMIISFAGMGRLKTTSDLRRLIPAKLPSIQAQFEQERIFGPQQTDFVLIYGDVMNPEVLRGMERLRTQLVALEYTTENKIRSIDELFYDLIKEQKGLKGSFSEVVPDSDPVVKQYYEEVKEFLPADLITSDAKITQIPINSRAARDSDEVLWKKDVLREAVSNNLELEVVRHEIGGLASLTADLLGNLVPTQIFTSIFALILSALLLMFIFQSIPLGLATLSVLLAGIGVEMGFLVLIRWPLDMMTALVSAMVIGVGIDYAIHVTWRFREEFGYRCDEAQEALEYTVMNVGRPIVASSLATAGAFLIITITEIMPVRRFGGVTSISLFFSLVATMLVLPSLLYLLARWRRRALVRKVKEEAPVPEVAVAPPRT